jgi:hypothetical protein
MSSVPGHQFEIIVNGQPMSSHVYVPPEPVKQEEMKVSDTNKSKERSNGKSKH